MSLQNLQNYYKNIFPYLDIFNVFSITQKREISFMTQEDRYIRYLVFNSPEEFKNKILEIVPKKLDIGAIYDVRPTHHLDSAYMLAASPTPIEKELVFDIDLSDYPRKCCDGKSMCKNCYELIRHGIRLLNYILRKEFGFKQIGFVFSGRRGFHCWVFDTVSKKDTSSDHLIQINIHTDITQINTDEIRYNTSLSTKDNTGKLYNIEKLHLKYGVNTRKYIYEYFEYVITKNLSVKQYTSIIETNDNFVRIDRNVFVSMNHLVKIPFCVHPDSGKISIVLDPENIIEFDQIPTIESIQNYNLEPSLKIFRNWR